jgi:hypothetical protein
MVADTTREFLVQERLVALRDNHDLSALFETIAGVFFIPIVPGTGEINDFWFAV